MSVDRVSKTAVFILRKNHISVGRYLLFAVIFRKIPTIIPRKQQQKRNFRLTKAEMKKAERKSTPAIALRNRMVHF